MRERFGEGRSSPSEKDRQVLMPILGGNKSTKGEGYEV